MIEYIQSTLDEIPTYLGLFVSITILAFISRGRKALKWRKKMIQNAAVNFVFLKASAFFGVLFFVVYGYLGLWYEGMNFPQIPREFWDSVPFPITAFILLFVYDFCTYWVHRYLHRSALWPMHAVHHSDDELHFLSWSRGHPIEQVFTASCLIFGSTWLGVTIQEFAVLVFLKAIHQYYVHSNIDWDHGPLHLFLCSPRFHRWHHVDSPEAYDKNFSSIFPILDKVFGTYYNPHPSVDMPTGLEYGPGNNLIRLAAWPFMEWARMFRDRFFRKEKIEYDVAE